MGKSIVKKIIAGVCAAAMILPLAACGQKAATAQAEDPWQNVTIWHYYNNAQLEAFQAIVAEFNNTIGQEKHITVTEQSLGYVDDLADAIAKSYKKVPGSMALPDMFASYSDTAFLLDQGGMVANLDDYFTEEELSAYNPQFLEEGRLGEGRKLKIFPTAKSTEALYLNKTDFEKFIAENPQVTYDNLKTIEGIIEASKVYYAWSGGKAFYGRDSIANYFVIGARQLGHDLFAYNKGGSFYLDTDEAVFRKLFDSYYVPLVTGLFSSSGKFRSTDMSMGDVLCYTGSTSSSTYFPKEVVLSDTERYEIESQVLPAPTFQADTVGYAVSQGAGVVVVKSDPAREKACVEFIKWFAGGDHARSFATDSSYLPVMNSQLNESLLDLVEDNISKESFRVGMDTVANRHLYTNAPSIHGNEIRAVFSHSLDELAKVNQGKIDEAMAAGKSHEEACAPYIGDAAFDSWYQAIIAQLAPLQ